MVTILKYKKITTDHDIYIKLFSDGKVSYLTVSTGDVLNTNNNETAFTELTLVFEEQFVMKFQEGSVLRYLNFRIFQSTLAFGVDQTDHIIEVVNEWFPTGRYRNFDTTFSTGYTYEKYLMAELPLTGNALRKAEMEHHGKFGHTLGRIQQIYLMNIIDICYETCHLATQTLAPTLPGFQCIKLCVRYMASHTHKPIVYNSNSYDGSNGIKVT